MKVIEILKEHLIAKGFDGLCYDCECSCEIANLQPCRDNFAKCEPGQKAIEDGDWIIRAPIEAKP